MTQSFFYGGRAKANIGTIPAMIRSFAFVLLLALYECHALLVHSPNLVGIPSCGGCLKRRPNPPCRSHLDRSSLLFSGQQNMDDEPDEQNKDIEESKMTQSYQRQGSGDLLSDVIRRFVNPEIYDPYLPLNDALVAQVVAPSLQIAWLSLNHAPAPTWLISTFSGQFQRGALLAPTLIHGAALATCWVAGALAAKAYQKEATVRTEPNGYTVVVIRLIQAGAFATGLLILGTQLDLLMEFGRYTQIGESEETDFRLYVAAVEVINDVFFEAITLLTWRLWLARQLGAPPSR